MSDLKVRVGTSHVFTWAYPEPIKALTPPSITFIAPDSGAALLAATNMSNVGPQEAEITSISDDRRTLTLSAGMSANNTAITGPVWGKAFIVSDDDGFFPVTVTRAVPGSTQVILAEALPRAVTTRQNVISWATSYVQLTSADVTATAQRDVLWRVTYSPKLRGEAKALPATDDSQIDEGRLHVVRRPFETGLTDADVKMMFPWAAQCVPHRQQGFEPTIKVAEDILVMKLRAEFREIDKWEDDIDGRALKTAHGYYVASLLKELQDVELAEQLRTRADSMFELGLRSVWLDADGDGVVDTGEDATQITGPRANSVGGSYRTSTTTPSFTRGQSH